MPPLPVAAFSGVTPLMRRLVLLCAIALGIAASVPPAIPPVHAMVLAAQTAPDPPAAASSTASPAAPAAAASSAAASSDPAAAASSNPAAAASSDQAPDAATPPRTAGREQVTVDGHAVVIERGNHRVLISGDRDFDSFDQFVKQAPWLAALVFLVLIVFFVVPLLIVVLLIWYKIRKARMQNETMIKLAEKGVVPPPEAMDTLAGRIPPGVAPSAAPLYEHARQLRRQAAWSDLRKGVVLIAIGIAFLAYSVINEGNPGWVGLICLFLGLGYVVLWILEDRGMPAPRDAGPPPAGGA